jgi:hypothetical protein
VTTRDSLLLPESNRYPVSIGTSRDRELRQFARAIESEEAALSVLSPHAPGMHGEILDAPSLVIEDHGDIRLFEHSGDEAYSYRALMLAGDDDLVAIGVARQGEFEAYCRDYLGLGRPRLLLPKTAAGDDSLARRCRKDPDFIASAAAHADAHGGLNILPYMGTWAVWELAAAIAEQSRAPLRVIAPPPQLTRRVNDKIWFARLLRSIFGQSAMPPAREADNFSRLCRQLMDLADTHASLAVKLPNSASSAGNLVLDPVELRPLSWQALHDRLEQRLRCMGWNGDFPLQVVAWEQPLSSSPSAQMWIPLAERGEPMVEAIFEQHCSGLAREFDGARPARLDHELQARIAQQAFEIGRVLQYLGYLGRCSLDAIVVGAESDSPQLHWVECNGRWGGVSLPLSLNRRLDRASSKPMEFVVLEEAHQRLPARAMQSVIRSLQPWLYRDGLRDEGAVLLSPGRLLDGSGFEIMLRAENIDDAIATAHRLAALLGKNTN